MTQLHALLLSLLIEGPAAAAIGAGGASGRAPLPRARVGLLAWMATCLTHPFAWAAFQALRPTLTYWPRAAIVELGVCVVEALLYRAFGLSAKRAVLLSTVANAASFGVGWLIRVAMT